MTDDDLLRIFKNKEQIITELLYIKDLMCSSLEAIKDFQKNKARP